MIFVANKIYNLVKSGKKGKRYLRSSFLEQKKSIQTETFEFKVQNR